MAKMTELEQAAKDQITNILNKQGYPTYSRLLDKLDVKLIDTEKNPNAIAYLAVNEATIYLNPNLNINQVSTIVRHEILHEYLTHFARAEEFKKKDEKYKGLPHELVNVAADYDISNVGYTDADKQVARSIILNDKVLQGLVTEDEHPDWENKTFEEMLEELAKDWDNTKNKLQNLMRDLSDSSELEKQSDEISDQAKSLEDQSESQNNQDKAQDIQDEAEDVSNKADSINNKQDKPFKSPEEQQEAKELQGRVDDLKKALKDLKNSIIEETEEAKDKEAIAKRAQDLAKYKETPLSRFADSLNNFIKNEVATGRGKSWSRINKKYSGTGLIRAGTSRLASDKVPLINVYFDRSGSWDSQKSAKGAQAIATLNKYVTRGQIKINLYYFSNNVHSIEQQALNEGGTYGQPILDHIEATKPDNVIILTDSDIDDCRSYVTVPGGVWMLFYEGRSQNLMNHLKGRKLTKYFDIPIR